MKKYRRKFSRHPTNDQLFAALDVCFPFKISREAIPARLYIDCLLMRIWCDENCGICSIVDLERIKGGGYNRMFDSNADFVFDWIDGFWFKNEKDAVLFKLRFG